MRQLLKLADSNVHITVFYVFKKLARDMKDIKKTQIKLLEMKLQCLR